MQKYRLTYPQQNIWLVEKASQDSLINTIVGTIEIHKGFNHKSCEEAINCVIKNNDIMRISLEEKNGEIYQTVNNYQYVNYGVEDLSSYTQKEKNEYINDIVFRSLFLSKKTLYEFHIFKYSSDSGAILMKIHHMIADAWSCAQIGTQLIEYLESGIDTGNKPSYIDFIRSESDYRKSDKYLKDKTFWEENLKNITKFTVLKENKVNNRNIARRYSVQLSKKINDKLIKFCKDNKLSIYSLFLAVISTYIYRVTNNEDIILGTPILNRANYREKQTLGMFISTLPMRINMTDDDIFIDLVKSIVKKNFEIFKHQKYPYTDMLKYVHNNSQLKGNLYNIAVSYQNARTNINCHDKYNTSWKFTNKINEELQIHITDMDNTGNLHFNYDYLVDKFSENEIEYLHERILTILEYVIENSNTKIKDILVMSQKEKEKILVEFNNTDKKYPLDKNFIQLFMEQAKKNKDKIAYIFEDEKITYKELDDKSNALANYIRKNYNIKCNDVIALICKRSIDMIIGILGIIKAGAAYLPIDPDFPEERIKYMLCNSNSKLIISNINELKLNIDLDILGLNNKSLYTDSQVIKISNNLEDLIYIIYTSGTTGNPKGVMITHRNIINLIYAAIDFQKLNENEIWGSFSTYSFDIFILENFIPLSMGKTIILSNEQEQKIPKFMNELIDKYKIEVVYMTPTRMRLILDHKSKKNYLKSLKKILLGGEVFPSEFYSILKERTKAKIYDGYGPTEITVWSSAKLLDSNEINIGKSLNNVKGYILDKNNSLLPIGVRGQLCIGGEGVAKGYYNNKKITDEKFITWNGKKIYKTGDLAYFDFNGDLHYCGRMDYQVKIHGLRIEISDIEENARKIPGIIQVAVKVDENSHICMYYTSKRKISKAEIKEYLERYLPRYMVPTLYKHMNKFELTTFGKINKSKLPVLGIKDIEKYKPTVTRTQKIIEQILLELLNIKKISIDSNFFEIGLDSLEAIELVSRLCNRNINITYGNIFDYPTIEKLAKFIDNEIEGEIYKESIDNYDYQNINKLLALNNINNINEPLKIKKIKKVLLTGATGFLGAHIIDQLLKENDTEVYCLIREKNYEFPQKRLQDKLKYYFGKKYNDVKLKNRIHVIVGEITKENLFEEEEEKKIVINNVDTVIHCAARVKHFGEEKVFKDINYFGSKNIADFCLKYNKKYIYISTLSVSGNVLEGGYIEQKDIKEGTVFDETSLYINQSLNNIYVYTKFLAERYILNLINKGLNAKIIRVGNLTNRSYDLKFQENEYENAFVNRIKAVLNIKVLPENLRNFYLEFSPIDLISNAILKLSEIDENFTVYHLFNHKHVTILRFLELLKKINIDIKFLSVEEFAIKIEELLKDKEKSNLISGIIIDLSKDRRLEYQTKTKIKSDFTIKLLKMCGFEWQEISDKYILDYMEYFKKRNFFNY